MGCLNSISKKSGVHSYNERDSEDIYIFETPYHPEEINKELIKNTHNIWGTQFGGSKSVESSNEEKSKIELSTSTNDILNYTLSKKTKFYTPQTSTIIDNTERKIGTVIGSESDNDSNDSLIRKWKN